MLNPCNNLLLELGRKTNVDVKKAKRDLKSEDNFIFTLVRRTGGDLKCFFQPPGVNKYTNNRTSESTGVRG